MLFRSLVLVLVGIAPASVLAQDRFDLPVKKVVVNFGPSEGYTPAQKMRNTLTCFYYRNLLVKQYDENEKGAESLSFVRFGPVQPECAKTPHPAEKVLHYEEWSGYFKGVKGDLVFFNAADGFNGGLPFAVYDSRTGKKIFEDSAYENRVRKSVPSAFNQMRVRATADGQILLTYLRVLGTECDIPNKAAECWPSLVQKLGLKSAAVPECTGYENLKPPNWSASAVAYPVEVSLLPTPTTRVITGPIKCWPVD